MITSTVDAEAAVARAREFIAHQVLDAESGPNRVGAITLYPHQRRAAARLRTLLRVSGGAMLADATGLGKTFVALAVASSLEQTLIIAPASLEESWRVAAARAAVGIEFISIERLSRGAAGPIEQPRLIVIDEAHHLRNPRTKRYAAVAELCNRAQVLLLSATPLQNRRDDLIAQLALFVGDEANAATDADLARLIVRRRPDEVSIRVPEIVGPQWIQLPISDDLLDDLLALPPPVPGSDEGTSGALVTYSLLRQWTSSRAALVGALRRRIAKAVALMTSLETGRWPSRDQLAAWTHADEALQLALPELLTPLGASPPEISRMLGAVRDHTDALRALLHRLHETPDPDPARAAALVEICRARPRARVLAFSQYAETVHALSHVLMRRFNGVAELTSSGGRVAGGRVSRREVLAQFAPRGDLGEPAAAERIDLLLTTDVLSEGLDLQRASVIVHLDLPWNPARLTQRVGRVRRLGSAHGQVFVYAFAPPASSERILGVVRRLRTKLRLAHTIVGIDSKVIPDSETVHPIAPPELASETLALLERWRDSGQQSMQRGRSDSREALYAGVIGPNDGLLALVAIGDERLLVAGLEHGPLSLDPRIVSRAVAMSLGRAFSPAPSELSLAAAVIRGWCEGWYARRRLAMVSPAGARARVRIAARITSVMSSVPRHEQAMLAPLASRAQRALRVPLGAGAERALVALTNPIEANAQWLRDIAALTDGRTNVERSLAEPEVMALILMRRERVG